MKIIKVIWSEHSFMYKVNVPNWDGGEVVELSEANKAITEKEDLIKQLQEQTNTRKALLDRIEEIRKYHGAFSKSSMRWNYTYNNVPLQDIEFNKLNDKDLIAVFEIIVRRHYVQM